MSKNGHLWAILRFLKCISHTINRIPTKVHMIIDHIILMCLFSPPPPKGYRGTIVLPCVRASIRPSVPLSFPEHNSGTISNSPTKLHMVIGHTLEMCLLTISIPWLPTCYHSNQFSLKMYLANSGVSGAYLPYHYQDINQTSHDPNQTSHTH